MPTPCLGTVSDKADRSHMNATFVLAPGKEDLQAPSWKCAKEAGCVGVKEVPFRRRLPGVNVQRHGYRKCAGAGGCDEGALRSGMGIDAFG